MHKRTVLITSSTYPLDERDPSPRFVHELARRLAKHFRVYVLAPSTPESVPVVRYDGVVILRHRYFFKSLELLAQRNGMIENLKRQPLLLLLVPLYCVAQLAYLRRIRKRIHVDIINAHWLYPQTLIAILGRMAGFLSQPILGTVHGGDLFSLKMLAPLKQFVLNRSDHSMVVGCHMKRYCELKLGIKESRVSVRSMGVDLKGQFTNQGLERNKDFIFVGRLAEKKGISVLLEAISLLALRNRRVGLSVIGGGDDLPLVKKRVDALGLIDQIQFLGKLPNSALPSHLNEHRFFIFPSIVAENGDQEGMPLSPVEAQGCGCIVISSDLDSTSDYLEHGKTGFTFKAGSSESLADMLEYVLDSGIDLEKISDEARQSAVQHFDWENVVLEYVNQLTKLIRENEG